MSWWRRLYNGQTDFEFVGRWKTWFLLSGLVILVGLAALFTRGFNLGIEFEGGVSWEVPAGQASVTDAREAVDGLGLTGSSVQELGAGSDRTIRVQAEEVDDAGEVTALLADLTGSEEGEISYQEVGPSWGDEITDKAVRALVVFLVLVTLYITLRFEWKMALATLAALLHDILVTVGVYAVFGFPVTPATVIAFLTILGYSIYDGIVVFDRVDENARALVANGDRSYSRMVNNSLNQVLMRTLNTSITALLPIGSLLFIGSGILGATTLQEFALALFIGLLSGAYSSLFIASPVLAMLKEREERWMTLRTRLGPKADERRVPVTAAAGGTVAAGDTGSEGEGAAPARPRPSIPADPIQPRGRKKGRRR
jgi:preprotein translocase subunit SecF